LRERIDREEREALPQDGLGAAASEPETAESDLVARIRAHFEIGYRDNARPVEDEA
jgi:hypothetical protein